MHLVSHQPGKKKTILIVATSVIARLSCQGVTKTAAETEPKSLHLFISRELPEKTILLKV